MKIIFRPIFVIFCTLLFLSFSFSLRKSSQRTTEVQESLQILREKNQALLLEEQNLLYEEKIAALPFTKEKIIRDQKWLQAPDDEVLKMDGYVYKEQTLPDEKEVELTAWQEWKNLLTDNSWPETK